MNNMEILKFILCVFTKYLKMNSQLFVFRVNNYMFYLHKYMYIQTYIHMGLTLWPLCDRCKANDGHLTSLPNNKKIHTVKRGYLKN